MATGLDHDIAQAIQNHGLILYDGDCGFCQFWVQFVLKRDPRAYFVYAPLQAPWVEKIYPQKKELSEFNTVLLYENEHLYQKSSAAFRILGNLRWPWRALKIFILLPPWISDFCYDLVARHRHRFGSDKYCLLPTDTEKKRFLN